MSPTRILMIAAGLVAISVTSAMADGFRYTGNPKLGQFRETISPAQAGTAPRASPLDAQAQMIEPKHEPKGGISARGP